jgi:hypothetical protein
MAARVFQRADDIHQFSLQDLIADLSIAAMVYTRFVDLRFELSAIAETRRDRSTARDLHDLLGDFDRPAEADDRQTLGYVTLTSRASRLREMAVKLNVSSTEHHARQSPAGLSRRQPPRQPELSHQRHRFQEALDNPAWDTAAIARDLKDACADGVTGGD